MLETFNTYFWNLSGDARSNIVGCGIFILMIWGVIGNIAYTEISEEFKNLPKKFVSISNTFLCINSLLSFIPALFAFTILHYHQETCMFGSLLMAMILFCTLMAIFNCSLLVDSEQWRARDKQKENKNEFIKPTNI